MALRTRDFKQDRSRRTYEAILRAAAKIFPRRGFDGTQVPDIAKAAGVSTGAVYRYFVDKREIFLEMLELHLGEARAEVDARLRPQVSSGVDVRGLIDAVIDAIFDQARKNPALARIYLAMSLTDPDVGALRATADAADRAVLALVLEAVPRDRIPDPAAAALVIQSAAVAAAIECGVLKSADAADIKPAVATAIHRYLFG